MPRFLLLYACCFFLCSSCTDIETGSKTTTQQQTTPNIIFILTDDQGYGDLSSYGSPRVHSPHLDQMAAEGLKMTSFYAFPSCSPSRAALMTGCYPPRVGIPDVVGPPGVGWTANKQYGLHPRETTLPEVLKSAGYATAMVGKWHLGHFPETMPQKHGFDQFFGLPYSNDMLPHKGYGNLSLMRNTDTLEVNPDQSQLVKRYTAEALDFIRQERSNPFFLYLAHSMPHVPIFASDDFLDKSGQGLYADVIAEIETQRIDDNTLVIFTSDNGPWLIFGNHGGSAGPFREGKGTTYEGGMRVPMIARWPGKITAGGVSHHPASLADILPTLAGVAAAELPQEKIDGRDLSAHLTSPVPAAAPPPAAPMCYYRSGNLDAVRVGKWKLHVPHSFRYVDVVEDDAMGGKYAYQNTGLELYDLEGDPGERYNIVDKFPEKTAELKALIEQLQAAMDAEKRAPFRPEVS
jgi:arylsulfatase A